ncbi:ABC transporter ATP-binding protein [Bifidobacterium sp. UTCIF-39]|uniref:App1 family protein n=1 Tax=Bifidobacterium sp. UTCIF-39 TaxID=1465359 RepID=UPI0021592F40|nr:phosphatase domain-containing protein [Bifidobacterium sp. UTCIF-39]TPF97394.1 ABC transporter ATP-binding protein [Bifidobacterium sp. UTCIF-39]
MTDVTKTIGEPDSGRSDQFSGSEEPIIAQPASSNFDAAGRYERIDIKPFAVRITRRVITRTFGLWSRISTTIVKRMGWFPRVEPYVGYGTGAYSRLICRTVYAPINRVSGLVQRGIRNAFMVPAAGIRVRISIDNTELRTVQVGVSEAYDAVDNSRAKSSEYAISDVQGYLDLVTERDLTPGVHDVSYVVDGRRPCHAPLYTFPADAEVGIISDVDDTVMVTQVPKLWRAVYNMLFLDPSKRMSVPSMSVFYSKLSEQFPDAPFFYLSTSPWNVESSIRHFIDEHGFPEGPLLLRDLDPRPKTFIPTGVQHKLEFVEQLMADFPRMRFILIGDDGQKDPTTYATIARRYPGRVIAIGIRQLSPGESGRPLQRVTGVTASRPTPVTDVPVFYGLNGVNLMKTMLPYLRNLFK